ncbi:hypothetical protein NA56DRAFT_726820 [Hyaloscypha hepaticicola]|uniref:ATPase AAA-type core domain-containing protein n=1 Tax=Hyaloscypha hepaticicola TaxID=2082293 RepID=A0A2J6PXC5_9HELO|nr:hypothetical protein NA56DRAFT_726820 [Hyaloscypha hepaticicola]
MFLTTNRVKQIDDAIASRIHFKIVYRARARAEKRDLEFFSEQGGHSSRRTSL